MRGTVTDIHRKYNFLAKKFNLPSYDIVNSELEVSTLHSKNFLLRQIRKRIHHKLDYYTELIEEVLQPDATICQMHEYRFFSDEIKSDIYKLYTRLMFLTRSCMQLNILNDVESEINFIKLYFKQSEDIKEKMLVILSTMKKAWKSEIDKDIKQEYFG
jgi:hypothetical protein